VLFWNSTVPYWNDVNEIKGNFKIGNKSLNGYEHNLLFRNDGSTFTEIGYLSAVDSILDSRGLAIGDLDNDGDQDMIVTALAKPVLYFENQSPDQHHFAKINLQGPGENPQSLGAQVTVFSNGQSRQFETHAGSSFMSQQDPSLFIGLGDSLVIDQLQIRWPVRRKPSGELQIEKQIFYDLPVDGTLTFRQGSNQFEFKAIRKAHSIPSKSSTHPLATLNQKPVDLNSYHGKILVANFWATWCAPCKQEMPELIEFYEAYKNEGVEVVGISVENQNLAQVKRMVWDQQLNYPIFIANPAFLNSGKIGSIHSIPTTIVWDAKGNEIFRHEGLITQMELAKVIQPLLKKPMAKTP